MKHEDCTLVFHKPTNTWRVENRPPPPPKTDPRFEWSSETWSDVLDKATVHYRKHGERTDMGKGK